MPRRGLRRRQSGTSGAGPPLLPVPGPAASGLWYMLGEEDPGLPSAVRVASMSAPASSDLP